MGAVKEWTALIECKSMSEGAEKIREMGFPNQLYGRVYS